MKKIVGILILVTILLSQSKIAFGQWDPCFPRKNGNLTDVYSPKEVSNFLSSKVADQNYSDREYVIEYIHELESIFANAYAAKGKQWKKDLTDPEQIKFIFDNCHTEKILSSTFENGHRIHGTNRIGYSISKTSQYCDVLVFEYKGMRVELMKGNCMNLIKMINKPVVVTPPIAPVIAEEPRSTTINIYVINENINTNKVEETRAQAAQNAWIDYRRSNPVQPEREVVYVPTPVPAPAPAIYPRMGGFGFNVMVGGGNPYGYQQPYPQYQQQPYNPVYNVVPGGPAGIGNGFPATNPGGPAGIGGFGANQAGGPASIGGF